MSFPQSLHTYSPIYNASWRCVDKLLLFWPCRRLSYPRTPIFTSLFWQRQIFSLQPHEMLSFLFRAQLYFPFIPAGPWRQGNKFNQSKGKLIHSGGKKITPLKLLANGPDVLLHVDISQSKFIRQEEFYSYCNLGLRTELNCSFYGIRQWLTNCWHKNLGKCFRIQ